MYEVIVGENFHEIYLKIVQNLNLRGETIWKTRECLFLNFVLNNPLQNEVNLPKNWKWAYAELFDRLTGLNPGTAFQFRSKWKRNLEREGGTFDYSYGGSFNTQIPRVLRAAKREFDREAIIAVWTQDHLDRDTFSRRPCTLTIQFYNRNKALHCFVNMRSNDVINLLPYDVFHHTSLQIYLASILGLKLGSYYHTTAQYYWPKRRDLRGYGPILEAKLKDAAIPEKGNHFPWKEPQKNVALASQSLRGVIDYPSLSDPYIQGLLYYCKQSEHLDEEPPENPESSNG